MYQIIRGAALALIALSLGACSTVELFDTLAPKDAGGTLAERDIAFGPDDRQRLNIYVPEEKASNPTGGAPVLFFIYGGSWKNGDKDYYDFAGRAFAAQGFVTVIADYRLVPDVRFPAFVEDGALAVKWVEDNIAEYGGDTDRFYLAGHSAGAYNAMMLALDRSFLDAAGVSPGLVDAVAGLSGPYDFYPFEVRATKDAFRDVPEAATATQPVAHVDPSDPPMFLVIGSDDEVVEPRNVTALAARAREEGVRVETKIYEGLDHVEPAAALSKPFRDKAPVLADLVAFFNSVEE